MDNLSLSLSLCVCVCVCVLDKRDGGLLGVCVCYGVLGVCVLCVSE